VYKRQIFIVFTRIGTAIMFMPAFGEVYVSTRIRLAFALLVTILVTPAAAPLIPPMPTSPGILMVIVLGESFIGLFIGVFAQILLASLTTAGTIIAFQSSMANAFLFNPATAQQSSLPGSFLAAIGLTLILVTDMHHLMLAGVVESYRLFPPGDLPPLGDFSEVITLTVASSFKMAMQIGAPFVFSGLLFYLGLGLLTRLIPNVQIFFIALPIQLVKGMVVLLACLSAIMFWWLEYFEFNMEQLLVP